jgi:hypothetical protein
MGRLAIFKILNLTRTLILFGLLSFMVFGRSEQTSVNKPMFCIEATDQVNSSEQIENNQDSAQKQATLIENPKENSTPIFSIGRLSNVHF